MSLPLLKRIIQGMERIAPLNLAEKSWDNVGLLLESPTPTKSQKVFLTIDLTSKTLQEAIKNEVGVIIAYHPPIFKSIKRLTMQDIKQNILLQCIQHNISIYSPHTAADNCCEGVNDWIADGLKDKSKVEAIVPNEEATEDQQGSGSGRIVTLNKASSLNSIIEQVKQHFGLKHIRVVKSFNHQKDSNKLDVNTIAICAGSGSSVLNSVEADVYLTGEMSHHDLLACIEDGKSIILGEHSNSERGYLKSFLKPKLEKLLNDENDKIEVIVSEVDRDPVDIL